VKKFYYTQKIESPIRLQFPHERLISWASHKGTKNPLRLRG